MSKSDKTESPDRQIKHLANNSTLQKLKNMAAIGHKKGLLEAIAQLQQLASNGDDT